jgi:PPOX class probable F420-dependent enzyme
MRPDTERFQPGPQIRETKTVLLTTFKRDGSPVGTPVSIAFDGDRAFVRTWHKAWTSKRHVTRTSR